MHSQVLLENNFITKEGCKKLINFYKSKPLPEQFDNTFPLSLITTDYLNLIKKLNEVSIKLNNSVVDYFQIVKWPSPSIGKVLHLDHAHSHTSLSSIIYLNDEFEGGHTYFEDKTSFAPLTGRAIFFDGQYFKHGVSNIKGKDRYTVATWFRKNEF
jgi:hypothetical protein|tara:strand:+ start:113 stop:580 length:468 start_codon:yes stop_codon:yes gene_type:complete